MPLGATQSAPPSRLRLRSNLVGTAIELPAPLRKPAAQALAADIGIRLPLENGEVEVALGDLLSLRSRSTNGKTGLRVQLGGGEAGQPPASGLVVGGRVERLDALYSVPLVMAYAEGMKLEEIAAALHVPKGTVSARMTRGRQKLKTWMEEEL